jgi:CRISPR-associated protein Csm5
MKNYIKQTFRCYLKILSPIHLGCDEVYEPMGFILHEDIRKLVIFDPFLFISQMNTSDREKFSLIFKKGTITSILEIYKFFKGRTCEGRTIDVCSGFSKHYNETLSIPVHNEHRIRQELNRFVIERTAYQQGDERPYIPGSAVKGALRTAYLNALANDKHVPNQKGKKAAQYLEQALLDGGRFETDPFRLVKVSDFMPVGEITTRIVYAVNEKKKQSSFKARGPYQIVEVIEPGAQFRGEITVEQPQKGAHINNPVKLEDLLKSVSWFYKKEKKREDAELFDIGITYACAHETMRLLRIGRHSGAESITIDGHRNILIRKGRGEKEFTNHATTLWLSSELPKSDNKRMLRPFGWAFLDEFTPDLLKEFQQAEEQWHRKEEAAAKPALPAPNIPESTSPPDETISKKPVVIEPSPLEKVLKKINVIKQDDKGQLAPIIDKIQALETDQEKAVAAQAIRNKMSKNAFKKFKKKELIKELIEKGKGT